MILILAGLLIAEGWISANHLDPSFAAIGFAGIASLFAWIACLELRKMSFAKGFSPDPLIMALPSILLIFEPFWKQMFRRSDSLPLASLLLATLFIAGFRQALRSGTRSALANLALPCLAVIYIGLGFRFFMQIRLLGHSSDSSWGQIQYAVLFLAVVKSTDIGAYFTGRFLGRHSWVPSISPQKTWEGLAGGIFTAMVVSFLFSILSGIISIPAALMFGWITAVSGQLGDLMESLMKRDTDSKDSGALVPEFGGVLDMIDSVVVAAPFGYAVLAMGTTAGAYH